MHCNHLLGSWGSAVSVQASTCAAWRALTQLFDVVIHNHQMLVPPTHPQSTPLHTPFLSSSAHTQGNAPTGSSQRSCVAFDALGDVVVMSTLGGICGSSVNLM